MVIGDLAAAATTQLNVLGSGALSDSGVNTTAISTTAEQLRYLGSISSGIPSAVPSPTNANGQNVAPKNSTGQDTGAPTPPKQSPNAVPQKGQPSIAPTAATYVNGTGINKTNNDLVHICDFTINLHLQACQKTWLTITENETLRLEALSTWSAATLDPIYDQIRTTYNTLKEWYNWIKKYIDQITSFIKCMQELIQAISQAISFIASLPSEVISTLSSCISGFEKLFTDSVNGLVNGVTAGLQAASNPNYTNTATSASESAPSLPSS